MKYQKFKFLEERGRYDEGRDDEGDCCGVAIRNNPAFLFIGLYF